MPDHANGPAKNETAEINKSSRPVPAQRLWTRDFIILAVVNLLVFTGGNMLVSVFPLYIVSLGGSTVTVGIAAAVYAVCSFCMRPIAGWILDNKSRRNIFLVSMVGVVLIPPLYLVLTALILIIPLRGLHALSWSAASTSISTNTCDVLPSDRFGEGMSFFGLTNGIAMIIGPALGLFVWDNLGMPPLFLGISACGLCCLVLVSRLRFRRLDKKKSEPHSGPGWKKLAALFEKEAFPASLLMCCLCFPGGAIESFIALFCQQTGVANGGVYFSFQAGGACITRIFAAKIYDRHGEGPLLIAGCLCFFFGLMTIVFSGSTWLFYSGALLYGVGYGLTVPAMTTMSLRTVPPERRGAASSTYLLSYDVSFGLGGLVAGVLAKLVGYRPMFCIMSVGILICFILYRRWGRFQSSAWRVWKNNRS